MAGTAPGAGTYDLLMTSRDASQTLDALAATGAAPERKPDEGAADALAATDERAATAEGLSHTLHATSGTTARSQAGHHAVLPLPTLDDKSASQELRLRYEQLGKLGEGGMGEVVLAEDRDIGRKVAIKRMKGTQDESAVRRFADEVRAIGRLDHPGVVPIHDVGIDRRGDYFLVMKHIQGDTLEQIIRGLKKGDPALTARFTHAYRAEVMAAVLETIDYAHQRGVLHRDLKPANIMVGSYGEVTVLDWGLAKPIAQPTAAGAAPATGLSTAPATSPAGAEPHNRSASSLAPERISVTEQGAYVGTPLYMSPEQAAGRNDELSTRSDVYSLSILFWEWMSLEHPRAQHKRVEELLQAIRNEPIDCGFNGWLQFSRIRTQVPCEYAWFAAGGLAHEPERRYADAGVMLRELRRTLRGEFAIRCHVTLVRRGFFGILRLIDRHGIAFNVLVVIFTLLLLARAVALSLSLMR